MISALIAPVTSLLDKFIEDKDQRARLAHEVATMAQKHAQELAQGQLEINNSASGSYEKNIECNGNGNVELYYDNSTKFETTSSGAKVTGSLNTTSYIYIDNNEDLWIEDNGKIQIGNGSDLQIYHDGSNSYLKAVSGGTGNLYIFADGKTIYLRPKSGEDGINVIPDGAVELYYNGGKKIETTSTGAIFTSGVANTTAVRFGNTANRGLEIKTWQSGGNNDAGVLLNAADTTTSGYGAVIAFQTGGEEKARFEGQYDNFRLSNTCSGITFNGDWAAQNRLNDYEEGSWDAYVSTSQNITINNVVAKYTKIGNKVTCWFNITRNETGSRSGDIQWNNSLPFTTANDISVLTTGTWWLDEGDPSNGDSVGGAIYLFQNSTQGKFVHSTSPGQQATNRYLQYSEWSQHRPIYGSFTYYV